jgi:small conductance mechanosensitive channel
MEELRAAISGWLDPQKVGELLLAWSGRILAAAAIFLIGRLVARLLSEWFSRAVQRVGVDQTLGRFFASLIYIGLLLFVAIEAVTALGVPALNFVALLGAAGLAVGLALKDSLSNFSSGVMLVFFRPFRVGDTVTAAGVSGTVDSIGMFSTVIKTADNVVITVPNSLVYAGTIQNFTAERTRRTEFLVWTSYDGSTTDALQLIREIVSDDDRVLSTPAPDVVVNELGQNGVCIAVRLWADSSVLGAVRSDMLERVKTALEGRGYGIPYQRMRFEQLASAK